MNLHTCVCFVYDVVHNINNTIHRGRTKMEIKKGKKDKSTSILMRPLQRLQLVNISVQNVYCRFSVQPCYL